MDKCGRRVNSNGLETIGLCSGIPWQFLEFCFVFFSILFAFLSGECSLLNQLKLRKWKRWRVLLERGGGPDYDAFYKEWRERGLPWPLTSKAVHDEKRNASAMIDEIERKNIRYLSILIPLTTAFALLAAVVKYRHIFIP